MITRCPSCSNHFDLSFLHPDHGGGMVRCPSCSHVWLEGQAIELSADAAHPVSPVIEPPAPPEPDIRQLMAASREAQEAFLRRRKHKRVAAAAWLGLALVAASPAGIALSFPETVVSAFPATIRFYGWMGREVNIYGLKIKGVDVQHLLIDGRTVIAIKGELVNISDRDRKIPWLRFGLKSADHAEVYHWQLDTESRPLRPGEAKGFVTRVAAPPESASTIEIRFARADEIGSNVAP
jgi:predicted Zn finger-like uncharacterized protein